MSVQQLHAALARDFAALAIAGADPDLSIGDLHAALTARRTLVPLLSRVVTTVARHRLSPDGPVGGALVPVSAFDAALTRHPVAVLARELDRYPLPASPWGFGDEPAPEPGTPVGRLWLRIGYLSEAVVAEWQQWPPDIEDDQRWSAVADVAALTEALTVADGHLVMAFRTRSIGHVELAEELAYTARVNLRLAAAETVAVAAAGPLPDWDNSEIRPGSAPNPVIVRTVEDLGAIQRVLADQVLRARIISPTTIAAVATGQARALAISAEALKQVDPDRAQRAMTLAHGAHDASRLTRNLAILDPDDRRPVIQVSELLRWVRTRRDRGWTDEDTSGLTKLVDAAPAVIRALAVRAHREAVDGSWLMVDPDRRRVDRAWVRLTGRVTPELCSSLTALAARTDSFPAPATSVRPRPPREALAGVAALGRRERPRSPSDFVARRYSPLWRRPPTR